MHQHISLMQLQPYLAMIITYLLVFGHIMTTSSESISSQVMSSNIQDLSIKIRGHKLDERVVESQPINEGFILIPDNLKHVSSIQTKSMISSIKTPAPTLHNISSTTCRTVTKIRTLPPTPSLILHNSLGHLGRRLLNEPSYDTDLEISSVATILEEHDEIDSFLKVDEEEMSRQLVDMTLTTDGSGETSEPTTEGTTASLQPTTSQSTTTGTTTATTTRPETYTLSNVTQIIIELNCTNANATINAILGDFFQEYRDKLRYNYSVTYNTNTTECAEDPSGSTSYYLNFTTDNNITALNNLLAVMENVTKDKDVTVSSVDNCGNNTGKIPVTNITSCTLINLCGSCGRNPIRGVCYPETGLSKCRCHPIESDPSIYYEGDFCTEPDRKPTFSPARWTPIIVGVLAGLAALFLAVTCCLWAIAVWRRRRPAHNKDDFRIRRIWHLPRAEIPTPVRSGNVPNNLETPPTTSKNSRSDSVDTESNTTDSTFFRELDQKMGEKLRATITRPNTGPMLASLPSDTMSTPSSYDPIDELDAIIDHEDLNTTFHDPLDDLYEDNEMLEVMNPNLKLPRPNIDSKATGLFSFFQ